MPVDEFLYLNPQHNRPVIAGADEYALLLPIDKAELFAAKLQLTNQPLVSWQAYRMRNGETLQQVAAKFGLEVEGLRAVNGIGAKAKVPVGHTCSSVIPDRDATAGAVAPVCDRLGRTFHQVKRGETLAGITTDLDVPADIRRWNDLTKTRRGRAGAAHRDDFAPAGGKAKRATTSLRSGGRTIPSAHRDDPGTHGQSTTTRARATATP
jgi:membrane-bound lytic murein transglycosylase D